MLLSLVDLTHARGGKKKIRGEKEEGKERGDEASRRGEKKRARKRGAALKIRNANSIMTHSFPRPGKRASPRKNVLGRQLTQIG